MYHSRSEYNSFGFSVQKYYFWTESYPYGGPVPNIKEINPPILTELGKKLAGL